MVDVYGNERNLERNDVYMFLKENKLEQYWAEFERQGYDDMKQLLTMTPNELDEVLIKDIGIRKIGHQKRLKVLFAVRSVVDKDEEQKNERERDFQHDSVKKTRSCK